MATNNRRPGVYSQYDVSSFYTTARSLRHAAVVAQTESEPTDTAPQTVSSYAKARELFPGEEKLLAAVQILFQCGVSRVVILPVAQGDYAAVLAAAAELPEIGAVVCDCTQPGDLQALMESVHSASKKQRERLGFVGIDNPEEALVAARALNSERMVICCPKALSSGAQENENAFFTAAAVAGTILAEEDAAHNWSAQALTCLGSPARLPEEQVQALLEGGVTVVEPVGEQVRILRVLTTRTTTGGISDRSMTGVNTVLITDEIMRGVRDRLEILLRGSRISTQSLDAILAQVAVELAKQQDNGLIESFSTPKVYVHEEDPSICVVELAFQVAHVLQQIHVVAHIQV